MICGQKKNFLSSKQKFGFASYLKNIEIQDLVMSTSQNSHVCHQKHCKIKFYRKI